MTARTPFSRPLSFVLLLIFAHLGQYLQAAPVPYAGKVAINGLNFSGNAAFTFALRDGNGTIRWRNGADANATINVPVDRGHYLVLLGGQGMNGLPSDLFLDNPQLYLQVKIKRPDTGEWLHLQPDQRINSAPHALSAEVAKLADLATLADAVKPGAITRAMLAAEVLADLNSTVHLPEQNATLAPGSVTLSHLTPGIRADLNATITRSRLAADVLTDLNRSIVITRNMLPASVLSDLNGTISRSRLEADVLADLNRTFSISPGSITANLLAPGLLDQNVTLAAGSVTKAMLATDVLADLNASSGSDGNGPATAAVPAGSLIAVQSGQSAPAGYSLYQTGEFNATLTWEEKAPVSVARSAYDGVEVLDGKIYFVGGHDGSSVKNIAERYDPATNQWETLNPMSVARKALAATVLNGKLYAIGGQDLSSVEIFDPQTGQWSAGPALPSVASHGIAITVSGKILLMGGEDASGQNLSQVLEFDSATNQWGQKTAMPTARRGLKLVLFEGKVWAIGGYDGSSYSNKVEIYDVSNNSWTTGPSLTTARHYSTAWVASGRVYVAGGYDGSYLNSIEVYDPTTNQWTAAGSLPQIKYTADAAVLGGKVYVVAGRPSSGVYTNKVHAADLNAPLAGVYDLYRRDGNATAGGAVGGGEVGDGTVTMAKLAPEVIAELNATGGATVGAAPAGSLIAVQSGQFAPSGFSIYQIGEHKELVWEEKAPVSVARSAFDGVEVLAGKIYFVGGYGSGGAKNTAERYDTATNQWETLAPMTAARQGVAAAILNGKLYAIGGQDLSSVEVFDPATGQWSAGPALPSEVNHGTAITLGGKILLVGGQNSADQNINQVLELDPATNQWSQKAPMPTARYGMKLVFFEGKVWAIGGYDGSTQVDKVEIYDPATNAWSTGPSLTIARNWPSAWVANGRIYVAGGHSGAYLNSIEVYDPATNQWVAAGSLPENREHADAAVLGDKVYLVAGYNGSAFTNKVHAADLNASVAGVFDLYRRDGNASSGSSGDAATIAPNSITTSQLSETILKYLKPEITSSPQSKTVYAETNASFIVSAEGKYLTYQWKRNGVDLVGENNATLTIPDVNATLHEGNYTVTVSNDFGSVDANTSLSISTLGKSQQQPASSGSLIKQLHPWAPNGIYWIGDNATNAVQAFVDMDNGGWALLGKVEPSGSRFAYPSQDWENNSNFGNASVLNITTATEAKSSLWATLQVSKLRLDETNSTLADGKTVTLDLGSSQTLSYFFTNSNGTAINTTNGSMLSFSRKDAAFQGNSGTHTPQVYANRSVTLNTSLGCGNLPVKVRLGTINIGIGDAVNTGFHGLGGAYYYRDAHNNSCCSYTIQGPFYKNTSGENVLIWGK